MNRHGASLQERGQVTQVMPANVLGCGCLALMDAVVSLDGNSPLDANSAPYEEFPVACETITLPQL
jgi:hypothetical protein